MKDIKSKSKAVTVFLAAIFFTLNIITSVYSQQNSVRLDGTTFFNTITAAYNSLGASISDPHVIELMGNYTGANETFPINLTQKTNSSAINTITIRPASGVLPLAIAPVFDSNTDQGIIIGGPFACIALDGADYIIIDGRAGGTGDSIALTIKNTNTSNSARTIEAKNGATNNIIRFVNCSMPGSSGSAGGRNIFIGTSTPGTGGNNSNVVEQCIVNGGARGVQTLGTATASGFTNNNTVIKYNTIKNQTEFGIFLGVETISNTILGNKIFMDTIVLTAVSYRGIFCQGVGTVDIKSNKIYDLHSAAPAYSIRGILVGAVALTAPGSNVCTVNVINNFISLMENNSFATAVIGTDILSAGTTPYTANVYNNSMRTGGTAGNISTSSRCLNVSQPGAGSSFNILNNLFLAERSGGNDTSINTTASYDWDGSTGGFVLDYNNYGVSDYGVRDTVFIRCIVRVIFNRIYYVIDTTGDCGVFCDHDCVAHQEVYPRDVCPYGIESHSNFKSVAFTSSNDLHLVSGKVGGDMNGMPLASVTTDIDGEPRNPNYPYRGADEGPALKILHVRAFYEGIDHLLHTGVTSTGPHQLRSASPPYAILSTCSGDLDNQSNVHLNFGDSIGNLVPFYIVMKQRNHLETWSADPTYFVSGEGTYIFDLALSAAYGNNMTGDSTRFKFYGGDVTQDGFIDLTDIIKVYNSAVAFKGGCNIETDITDDGIVDLADINITYNNSINGVSVKRP